MSFENLTTTWTPRGLSVLRIMSALLFMEHGTLKILGFPASNRPAMELLSLGGIAGFLSSSVAHSFFSGFSHVQ